MNASQAVGVRFDHVALSAAEPKPAAEFVARILGCGPPMPDGADGDLFNVALGDGSFLLYGYAERPASSHLAFRLSETGFHEALARLRAEGIPFGNDPDDAQNGLWSDPLGGIGRAYFLELAGHLLELCA